MKVLCHAGPWSDSYFRFLVNDMYPESQCVILSGHRSVDESGAWAYYNENVSLNGKVTFASTTEDADVMARCRLMRAIDEREALLHLYSMRQAIGSALDKHKPDIVLTETVDSFIIDVLQLECRKREIPCVGLVTVFVNGCYRVSIRGEYVKSRDVSAPEVKRALDEINTDEYLPSFVVKDRNNLRRSALRKWLRNLIKIPYFFFKLRLSGDRYNNHYWQSLIVSKQWASAIPVVDPGSEDWELRIHENSNNVIYLPLQMFPEATIDYWCNSQDVIDYENVVVELIRKHPDLTFLVKEHPNVAGYRSSSFYRRIQSFPNVVFCPTAIPSNKLQDAYSAVLVWTGTVGFESAIRGKPVLCMSQPYYFPDNADFLLVSMNTTSEAIIDYIGSHEGGKSEQYKELLVHHLLNGCLPGRVRFDGSWSEDVPEYVSEAKVLASSLKEYIEDKVLRSDLCEN